MYTNRHRGQGAIWIILIIAIVALIALWISKNPTTPISTTSTTTEEGAKNESLSPTPTKSLLEIESALKDLNTGASEIDKGINDTQLDISK